MDLTGAFRDVLEKLGLRYTEKGNRLEMCCPFHSDTTPSSGVYKSTGKFFCFSCDLTLDAASFYARATGSDEVKVRISLEEKYGDLSKGVPPEVRFHALKTRGRLEKKLRDLRCGGGSYKVFQRAAELADRLIWLFEQQELTEEGFDKVFDLWYNTDIEAFEGAHVVSRGTEQDGAAGTDFDGWVPKGIADVLGARKRSLRNFVEDAPVAGSHGLRQSSDEGSDLIELT